MMETILPFPPSPHTAPPKKLQQWRAALGPTPVHARSVDFDVRARPHSARARNLARLSGFRTRAQLTEWFAMVHAPHEYSRGVLRDHYLSRRKCASQSFLFVFKKNLFRFIKFLLTDLVCAWRAAVRWNYDRRVLAILAL